MEANAIDFVRRTYMLAAERVDIADAFYERLFTEHPAMRHIFPKDMTTQKQKMVDALGNMVRYVDRPDVLATMMIPLGRRHGPYGASLDQVDAVIQTLASVVKDACLEEWSTEAAHDL